MGTISRQIGWSQESNLLYQILKQLNKLTSVMFGLKPKYKVYTALLTQTGGDDPINVGGGDLIIGGSYIIVDNSGDSDFTNVGAPNNKIGTGFVATGTTPNSWGTAGTLSYNAGAPVPIVLENTIGNVWFTYSSIGDYKINSNDLFTINKTFTYNGSDPNFDPNGNPVNQVEVKTNDSNNIFINTFYIDGDGFGVVSDDIMAIGTPIEIRVYN